jgi:hypothetical protein
MVDMRGGRVEPLHPRLAAALCGDGATVLDGELVESTTQEPLFLVFDSVWVSGKETGCLENYLERLKAVIPLVELVSSLGLPSSHGAPRLLLKETVSAKHVRPAGRSSSGGGGPLTPTRSGPPDYPLPRPGARQDDAAWCARHMRTAVREREVALAAA